MHYILVNDTSATNNPGCQATVSSLLHLLAIERGAPIDRIAVGTGYEHFVEFTSHAFQEIADPPTGNSLTRLFHSRHRAKRQHDRTSADLFGRAVDELEQHFSPRLVGAEVMVINGEGTIHHDRVGAYLLAGWAELGNRLGMSVVIVNATIESMSDPFWNRVRQSVQCIVVREELSFDFASAYHPNVVLGADAIFANPRFSQFAPTITPEKDTGQANSKRAAYTPGVLSFEGIVNDDTVGDHLRELLESFDEVDFIVAEVEDERFVPLAIRMGCGVKSPQTVSESNVLETLAEYDLLISGRYHYCIFAMLAGTAVRPLESNTWKIPALIRFGNHSVPTQRHCDPLRLGPAESDQLLTADSFDLKRLTTLANRNDCLDASANLKKAG